MSKIFFPLHPAQHDVYMDQLINIVSPQYNIGGYIVLITFCLAAIVTGSTMTYYHSSSWKIEHKGHTIKVLTCTGSLIKLYIDGNCVDNVNGRELSAAIIGASGERDVIEVKIIPGYFNTNCTITANSKEILGDE